MCGGTRLDNIAVEPAGIADGGEIEFHAPGTAAWLFETSTFNLSRPEIG